MGRGDGGCVDLRIFGINIYQSGPLPPLIAGADKDKAINGQLQKGRNWPPWPSCWTPYVSPPRSRQTPPTPFYNFVRTDPNTPGK